MASSLSELALPDVETMSAEEVLVWSYETFGDKLCLTCSWQKQSSALVHMVSELGLESRSWSSTRGSSSPRPTRRGRSSSSGTASS